MNPQKTKQGTHIYLQYSNKKKMLCTKASSMNQHNFFMPQIKFKKPKKKGNHITTTIRKTQSYKVTS